VFRDVEGLALNASDRERLLHPSIGGVVLFHENYRDRDQLRALVGEIKALRSPSLLVSVDQEGGRVQRFRDQFVRLPAMAPIGKIREQDVASGKTLAYDAGFVMASELRAMEIDISFAPVLDLNLVTNPAIGDRAFHSDPKIVTELAGCLIQGMADAGMPSVGKHFPGHGGVSADSHAALPVDARQLAQIRDIDLAPYVALIDEHRLDAVMTCHVQYEHIDPAPSTFSDFWLQQVLRKELGFNGIVFSDDLHMQAAVDIAADPATRARTALASGCDVVLICRDPAAADAMCEASLAANSASAARLDTLWRRCQTLADAAKRHPNIAASSPRSWDDRVSAIGALV
jgi:beta-N-acetylhexosaminidase